MNLKSYVLNCSRHQSLRNMTLTESSREERGKIIINTDGVSKLCMNAMPWLPHTRMICESWCMVITHCKPLLIFAEPLNYDLPFKRNFKQVVRTLCFQDGSWFRLKSGFVILIGALHS